MLKIVPFLTLAYDPFPLIHDWLLWRCQQAKRTAPNYDKTWQSFIKIIIISTLYEMDPTTEWRIPWIRGEKYMQLFNFFKALILRDEFIDIFQLNLHISIEICQ